jgi:hypothetical protein
MPKNGHKKKEDSPKDLPNFALPSSDEDYELWAVRLPQQVKFEDLQGKTISAKGILEFESNDRKYTLTAGSAAKTESFRLLTKKVAEDGIDSDDDEDYDDRLIPSSKPFVRHFTAVEVMPATTETELAPRIAPVHATGKIRRAYEHVPPKVGLKRRWIPLGGSVSQERASQYVTTSAVHKLDGNRELGIMTNNAHEESTKQTHESNGKHEAERRAKEQAKKEKKEAKKARKERKRQKTEH